MRKIINEIDNLQIVVSSFQSDIIEISILVTGNNY